MKILLIHNSYQLRGGEDSVLESELELLNSKGHKIKLILLSNEEIQGYFQKIKTALNATWSGESYRLVSKTVKKFNPDIVHVHNFFPLLTPSIYDACIEEGVAVVQTLHNFRTICPGGLLLRDGKICEKCINNSPYQAVIHRCYRKSFCGSWAVARMVQYHRRNQTWQNKVDRFIALTQFGKQKFVSAGFPARKIMVKPNFCEDIKYTDNQAESKLNQGALFVGRFSEEKGLETLFAAWENLKVSLRMVGKGPLGAYYANKTGKEVEFLGSLSRKQVFQQMADASFLVMPSKCYEGFPIVLVESFAHGLPVVVSRLGAMAEIVDDGVTGLHFDPGNHEDLAKKVEWMSENPEKCRIMGVNARKKYEEFYSPEKNYELLMDVYNEAIISKTENQ